MSWIDHIQGSWPADDLRRAFVMGAEWWELQATGATMWPADRRQTEAQAEAIFPDGKLPTGEDVPSEAANRHGGAQVKSGGKSREGGSDES